MGVNRNHQTHVYTRMHLLRDAALLMLLTPLLTIFSDAEEYCERESFRAQCNESQVVLMEKADFGRMKRGRCLPAEAQSLGCAADMIVYMDRQCSGRRQCEVEVYTLESLASACSADLKTYLDADYSCIDVFDGPSCLPNSSLKYELPSEPGFLSSITRIQKNVGSRRCPWSLRVQPGQLIEVILYDFSLGEVLSIEFNQPCPVIFVAIEADGEVKRVNLCDPVNRRVKLLHTSRSNYLTFYLENNNTLPQVPYFVLRHQVIGCPDIETPDGAYVTRTRDSAVFRCNATGETWYLVCGDVRWIGEVGNCTEAPNEPQVKQGFPWGIVIAVAIGIAIGCVAGGLMLCIVFACRKCYRQRKDKKKRGGTHDLSKIEIPSMEPKQIQEEPLQAEGIYSRPPRMGGPTTISHGQYPAYSMAGPSHMAHPEHTHIIHAQTHGRPHGQGPPPSELQRHGSLPREPHARQMQRQHSLPKPSLVRRNSSEEHIYEKTPYDAYSMSSSHSGSLGKRNVSLSPHVPNVDNTPHYQQYGQMSPPSTIYDGQENMRF